MNRMETTDIVIHKGEKEEKYQLYVEDYVMSYLKKYGTADGRRIFFYGTREQKNKKYYIYGAGRQKNISYFVRYELLDEIVCRYDLDMPVFSIKEDSERYELAGYYIFYQSNEAMQSYMVEQRKEDVTEEKAPDKPNGASKIRPQDFADIRNRNKVKPSENTQEKNEETIRTNAKPHKKEPKKSKGGIMAFQLSAVLLLMVAMIINSTNSYTKLHELGQSAIEVFFTMENQEASNNGALEQSKGTTLKLEDLDAEFEKENQVAKQEDDEESDAEENNASDEKEGSEDASAGNTSTVNENAESVDANSTSDGNLSTDNTNADNTNENNDSNQNSGNENENGDTHEGESGKDKSVEESTGQEAFARNIAQYYQIEKGDTLCNISIKVYGDDSRVNEICEINKIEDPDNIKYGQKILLP